MIGLERLLAKLVGKVVMNQLLWRVRTPKEEEFRSLDESAKSAVQAYVRFIESLSEDERREANECWRIQASLPENEIRECQDLNRRIFFDIYRRRAEQGGYLKEYLEEMSKDGNYIDLVDEYKVIQDDFVMGKEKEDWILG